MQPQHLSSEEDGDITAREAIAIATEALEESGLLQGDIEERVATPENRDGVAVWVVEFTAGDTVATVVVDAADGRGAGTGRAVARRILRRRHADH